MRCSSSSLLLNQPLATIIIAPFPGGKRGLTRQVGPPDLKEEQKKVTTTGIMYADAITSLLS